MNGILLLVLTLLSAASRADVFVRDDIIVDPVPNRLTVCHGNGCRDLGYVSLTPQQWQDLRAIFHPLARNSEEERERLRSAVALMERFVGADTGTWRDKGGTFNSGEGQMDCIDESINTTLYLTMFQRFGLMREHRVEDRATRGWFLTGWPHTTAVISEPKASVQNGPGRLWAVDSWFLDNGEPPFILPLETWRSGWEPTR
mgnify:CR=1 FL=1|jgi:hypothetical protein